MKRTDEKVAKAQELRARGWSYEKIGSDVSVSGDTVRRWLDPAAQQYVKEYCRTHKDKIAHYRQSHKAKRAQLHAKWYRDHRAEQAQYKAERYYADIEEGRRYGRENARQHKAQRHRYAAKYRKEHLSHIEAKNAERRALLVNAAIDLTTAQRTEIAEIYRRAKEDHKVRCYLCGRLIPLGHRHVDHIVPLSKGGLHKPSNLAVACDACNVRKNDKSLEEVGILL